MGGKERAKKEAATADCRWRSNKVTRTYLRGLAVAAGKDPRTRFPARIPKVYPDSAPEFRRRIQP